MTSASIDSADPQGLVQAGTAAMRQGDARRARALFELALAGGRNDPTVLLGLAYACKRLRDHGPGLAAADKALTMDGRNVRALILKADLHAALGDRRGASQAYTAAVKAARDQTPLPPDLAGEVRRAQTLADRYAREFEEFLLKRLNLEGSPRFAHSLDILFGKRQIYVQEPRTYFFPGLPQIQFYSRRPFPWLDLLEAHTGRIREEMRSLMQEGRFEAPAEMPMEEETAGSAGIAANPDWNAVYLWKNGRMDEAVTARCPQTMKALEGVPLVRIPGRSPSVLFSMLRPGARIPPRNGQVNTRLICHLPLMVPEDCGMRVGNEMAEWQEGRAWLFDDSIQHEAWNRSDRPRVILMFEVWRPELTPEERAQVVSLFKAIDAYAELPPEAEG